MQGVVNVPLWVCVCGGGGVVVVVFLYVAEGKTLGHERRKCHSNRLILTNGASHQQIRRKRLCWRTSCRRRVIRTDMEKYWVRPPSSATFLTSADGLKDTVSRVLMQTEAALCCSNSAKPQNIWASNLVFSATLRLRIHCHKEALGLLGSETNLPNLQK